MVDKRIATLNLCSLDFPVMKEWYTVKVKNRFESLSQLLDIKVMWDSFKTEVTDAARTTLGLQVKVHCFDDISPMLVDVQCRGISARLPTLEINLP
ncbi:hypothetical protein QYM36_002119 [Artemia franciscana]|uniref:Uncharacterized protein n=1 Tax=Artemia franciscana TaxID=6661 RepID=A0AA88I465_ARTSF|nr:hypothetical protein QYM36_002119 [Artemia franciscana]